MAVVSSAFVVKNDPELQRTVKESVLPQVEALFQKSNIQEATELVHKYERKLRLSEDQKTLSLLFETFVVGLVSKQHYEMALNELVYFGKKKHILESSLKTLVSCIYSRIEQLKSEPKFEELLVMFTQVTEGKIYAEVDQAKAVLQLVYIWEQRNEKTRALELISKSHVETYSNLDFPEKTDFILEQMRLCLECKEHARFELVSKKISQKFLKESKDEKYLLKYHDYMIKYYVQNSDFFSTAKSVKLLLSCAAIKENVEQKNKMLKLLTTVLILSELNSDARLMMKELKSNDDMVYLPSYMGLLKAFMGEEIIQLSKFNELYKTQIFSAPSEPFVELIPADKMGEVWTLLELRLNERNLIIMSRVFSSVTLNRVAQILEISPSESEDLLVEMIAGDKIVGRINRMGNINIVFKCAEMTSNLETLDKWSQKLEAMMKLVESTCYMIRNEEMIQAAN